MDAAQNPAFTPPTRPAAGPADDFINAFAAGQALARRGEPAPPTDPAAAPTDPAASVAAITTLTGAPREAARRRSEQLGAVFLALQGAPDGPARLAMARHAAPAFGLDPGAVSPADVSDTALAAHRAQALLLQHLLTPPGADARRPPP